MKKGDPSGFVKLQLVAKNEKNEGGPFVDMKNVSKKNFKLRFLNSATVPKHVKGGTRCNTLTCIVLQNIETKEGGPFGAIQKLSKSLIVPKQVGLWGDP